MITLWGLKTPEKSCRSTIELKGHSNLASKMPSKMQSIYYRIERKAIVRGSASRAVLGRSTIELKDRPQRQIRIRILSSVDLL